MALPRSPSWFAGYICRYGEPCGGKPLRVAVKRSNRAGCHTKPLLRRLTATARCPLVRSFHRFSFASADSECERVWRGKVD